jgi:hypothetical protein
MIMNSKLLVFFALILIIASCQNDKIKLVPLDLVSHGMPIKINAPEDATVEFDDIGIIKEIEIKSATSPFHILVISSEADVLDAAQVIEQEKADIESSTYFSIIVTEDVEGFIYEKKVSEEYINYDFRHIKIRGDRKYVYKAGLGSQYTVDEIKTMYKAVL